MKARLAWLLPLFFITFFIPFTPWLDLTLANACYTPVVGTKGHFIENGATHFLYHWGECFGIVSGFISLSVYITSFFWEKWKKARQGALVLSLTLALGAGLIVNAGFKEIWGRPRPQQIENFGGSLEYRPFWKPNFSHDREPQKSFPSGHVAMGFYAFALCLIARRYKSPLLWTLGISLTAFLGGGLFIGRIIQGGHFFSDALFSVWIMWCVAYILDKVLFTSAGFLASKWVRCQKLAAQEREGVLDTTAASKQSKKYLTTQADL